MALAGAQTPPVSKAADAAPAAASAAVTAPTAIPSSATPAASAPAASDPELMQRVEQNIRAHFKIPASVKIEVSPLRPSELPGYDNVSITLTNATRKTPYTFFVSRDGHTLAQLNKIDISRNPFDVSGRPSRGAADAKVTLMVYDDFQCPYCARAYKTLFSDILPEYKDKVRVVYKDFPLYEIHPWAIHAAVDANCLYAQNPDAYWDFADYVHLNQEAIKGDHQPLEAQFSNLDKSAEGYAQKHTLDLSKLGACVKAQDDKEVMSSVKYGEDVLQIDATPTLFINGNRFDGAVPADDLRAALDSALRDAGVTPPVHAPAAAENKSAVTSDNAAAQQALKAPQPSDGKPAAAPAASNPRQPQT